MDPVVLLFEWNRPNIFEPLVIEGLNQSYMAEIYLLGDCNCWSKYALTITIAENFTLSPERTMQITL